jgi:hypothetical protein
MDAYSILNGIILECNLFAKEEAMEKSSSYEVVAPSASPKEILGHVIE